MTQMTDAELFALMDTVAEMRDDLEHRVTVARKCSREANYNKYHYLKQHSALIASACDAPAGFGDWGADLCTMTVEKGMELVHRAWYHQKLQNKADKARIKGGKKISRRH